MPGPDAALAAIAPEPAASLGEAAISTPAENGAELADASEEAGLVEPTIAPLVTDGGIEPALLADSLPAEPATELIPFAASSDELAAGEPAGEAAVAAADPPGGHDEVAPGLRQPELQAAVPSGASGDDPGTTIPRHLARIGERYTPAPSPAPETPAQAAAEQPGEVAVQLDAGPSAAAVTVVEAPASTMIVQEDQLVAIRLGDLVSLFEDRLDHPLYVWLKSSASASKFVTAETLAAAGIHARYDPQTRQIVFSAADE